MQIVPQILKKNTAQNSPKHSSSSKKYHFFLGMEQGPSSGGLQSSRPDQAFWIRLCVSPEFQPGLRPRGPGPT